MPVNSKALESLQIRNIISESEKEFWYILYYKYVRYTPSENGKAMKNPALWSKITRKLKVI